MTFEQWMKRVNWWLLVRGYPGTDDLVDYDYREAFEDGGSAAEAAEAALDEDSEGSLMRVDDSDFWNYMSVSDADTGL